MTDDEALLQLVEYVEGDLSPDRHRQLGRFYEQHPNFLASYRKVTELCRKALHVEPPAGAVDRLLESLRRDATSSAPAA